MDVSKYFLGVAAKYLSAVDAEPSKSNQHEIGGLPKAGFKELLGNPGKNTFFFQARFLYISDDENSLIISDETVSWYDSRRHVTHRGPELRLYYPDSPATEMMSEGDLFIITMRPDRSLLIIITPPHSTSEHQLKWLFELNEFKKKGFTPSGLTGRGGHDIGFAARTILNEIGVETEVEDDTYLDLMIDKFGNRFPTTRIFSDFSRILVTGTCPVEEPDRCLLLWIENEEKLFRIFEKHIVGERLRKGFSEDVDGFIKYSLSVQNRRKSRAGHALENHIEQIFTENRIRFVRGGKTENNSKPDFLFPSVDDYHNLLFPEEKLKMLGSKSTCKDRWRQVLSEAARIKNKHLLTLEPGISKNQTDEMQSNNLTLVVPESLHATYTEKQADWLMSLSGFIDLIT